MKKVELQQRMADANAAIGLWKKCRDVLHQKESALRVRLANVQAGEKMLHYVLNQDQIVKAQSMVRRWLKRKHDSKEKRKEFVFLFERTGRGLDEPSKILNQKIGSFSTTLLSHFFVNILCFVFLFFLRSSSCLFFE